MKLDALDNAGFALPEGERASQYKENVAAMSEEKLQAARGLIAEERFWEARAILEKLPDDPEAREMLAEMKAQAEAEGFTWTESDDFRDADPSGWGG